MSTKVLQLDVEEMKDEVFQMESRVRDVEDALARVDHRLKELDKGLAVALRHQEAAWSVIQGLAALCGVRVVVEHKGTGRARVELAPLAAVRAAGPLQ